MSGHFLAFFNFDANIEADSEAPLTASQSQVLQRRPCIAEPQLAFHWSWVSSKQTHRQAIQRKSMLGKFDVIDVTPVSSNEIQRGDSIPLD